MVEELQKSETLKSDLITCGPKVEELEAKCEEEPDKIHILFFISISQ